MSDVAPPILDTDPNPASGFLGLYTTEDLALKARLSQVTVTDLNASWQAPRPVPVWFHNPEREERRITYPSIIIAFDGERVAHEREHRGYTQFGYRYLQNVPFDSSHPVKKYWPIPMDFDYTVTVQARINQHISQMSSALAMGPLHPRFAVVECPGGTIRRLEVLGTTRTTTVEADKRLFRQIYRVRIPTEIEDPVGIATTRVAKVVLSLVDKDTGDLLFGTREITATGPNFQLPDIDTGQYQSQTAGE